MIQCSDDGWKRDGSESAQSVALGGTDAYIDHVSTHAGLRGLANLTFVWPKATCTVADLTPAALRALAGLLTDFAKELEAESSPTDN